MQPWLASITTATPSGFEILPDAVGDLRGQPLLHLQPARKGLQHARELGDADDMVARQIGDMRLADDRRHVMLAMRLERDVLEQHDLVIAADFLEDAREMIGRIVGIALAIFLPGARDALAASRAGLRASDRRRPSGSAMRIASLTSSGTSILAGRAYDRVIRFVESWTYVIPPFICGHARPQALRTGEIGR